MGKSEDSEKNSICDDDDDRARTPIITGPIIELRGREVVFAISVFFLSAIVVGLIVVLASNKVKETTEVNESQRHEKRINELHVQYKSQLETERKRYCLTPDCVRITNRVLANIDGSVKPCDDFWKYSCGGWLMRNVDGYGVGEAIAEKIHGQMKSLMERKKTKSSSKSEPSTGSFQTKVYSLYHSCMDDEDENGDDGMSILKEMLNDDGFGGWSAHDDWNLGKKSGNWRRQKALQKLQFDYDVEAFFTVNLVSSNEHHAENRTFDRAVIIRIGKLSTASWGLPDYSYYHKHNDNESVIIAYKNYMSTVARLFNVTENKTEEFVHSTFNIEKRLAQLHEHEESSKNEQLMTVGELQRLSPRIKWLPFFEYGFYDVTKSTQVLISNADYLSNVSTVIDTTDEIDLNAYFVWRLISRLAVPLLSRPFREAHETYSRAVEGAPMNYVFCTSCNGEFVALLSYLAVIVLTGFVGKYSRHDICMGVLGKFFGKALSAMYLREYFSTTTMNNVREIINSTKHVFHQTLLRCHWMDSATRKESEEKLEGMEFVVGGAAVLFNHTEVNLYYENFSVSLNSSLFENVLGGLTHQREMSKAAYELDMLDTEDGMANSYTADITYYHRSNSVGIPAGILQDPYFNNEAPAMMNFGSIGSLIAHEMTHAFDESGAAYNKSGYPKNWWTDDTWDRFHRGIYCMQEAYKTMTVGCLGANCQRTVEENIADVGGLRLAYKAFDHWTSNKPDKVAQLPVANLSNHQVFFIAYAQNYCKRRGPANLMEHLKKSSRSAEPIRVRGSVSQFDKFAEAFTCEKEEKMNPINRCLIW